jgi:hypothetical protein
LRAITGKRLVDARMNYSDMYIKSTD